MITVVTAGLFAIFYLDGRRRNHDMEGKEQGSADWLLDYTKFSMSYGKKGFEKKEPKEAAEYRKKMMSEEYTDNIMFDNTYGISMNTRKLFFLKSLVRGVRSLFSTILVIGTIIK